MNSNEIEIQNSQLRKHHVETVKKPDPFPKFSDRSRWQHKKLKESVEGKKSEESASGKPLFIINKDNAQESFSKMIINRDGRKKQILSRYRIIGISITNWWAYNKEWVFLSDNQQVWRRE